jgi:hypothetical protein
LKVCGCPRNMQSSRYSPAHDSALQVSRVASLRSLSFVRPHSISIRHRRRMSGLRCSAGRYRRSNGLPVSRTSPEAANGRPLPEDVKCRESAAQHISDVRASRVGCHHSGALESSGLFACQSGNRCERDDFLDVHGLPCRRGVDRATRCAVDKRSLPGADRGIIWVSQDCPVGP